MTIIIICTLHKVNSFITMNTQITNSDFSNNGKLGETNESFPRKSFVSFAEKTESIDLSTQVEGCKIRALTGPGIPDDDMNLDMVI